MTYAFSSMRIRMAERSLLNRQQWERLLSAESLAEAVRLLMETRYSEVMGGLEHPEDFEKALTAELSRQAAFLSDLVKEPEDLRMLFLKFDYHNLKVLIKQLLPENGAEIAEEETLSFPFGSLFIPQIREWVTRPGTNRRDTLLAEAVAAGVSIWNQTKDAQQLDFVLDQFYFRELFALAKGSKSRFFENYASESADFTNLLSFFRAQRQNRPIDFFAEVFIPGGKLSFKDFTMMRAGGNVSGAGALGGAGMIRLFHRKHISGALEASLCAYLEDGAITDLEKARDEFTMKKAEEARRVQAGPEVLFSYMLRVESEIQNLRIILSGKRSEVPAETIRTYLRQPGNFGRERGNHA
ncbi:V-type ATPase subunit [Peptoniphilaceae bacterium SGI.137]